MQVFRRQLFRTRGAALALTLCLGPLTACSLPSTSSSGNPHKQVVVATHDAWAMSPRVLKQFTAKTGYQVKIEPNGDVGELTNKLVLTKGAPIADMVYGIDNTFASRAVDKGVLAPYSPRHLPASVARFDLPQPAQAARLTPVDYGDVCVNVDDTWFAAHHLAAPRSLGDLVKPAYEDLLVTPGASTSSTGLAFLLATVARYGRQGWQGYWRKLMANGAEVTSGWSEAYEVDFTGGGGHGDRPIVVSYSSSPPFTIPKGATRPTTSALLGTCFRQVEYAGVLAGAANPAGARAFIRFMLGRSFQRALPDNMYVYPVATGTALPAAWAKYAPISPHPFSVPPTTIAAMRASWLRTWANIVGQ
jgi:thiamine transport system substrate-binding protein